MNTPIKYIIMKLLIRLMLFIGFLIISGIKERQMQQTNSKSLNTGDHIVSQYLQITPDSDDNTLTMKSATYEIDLFKKNKCS